MRSVKSIAQIVLSASLVEMRVVCRTGGFEHWLNYGPYQTYYSLAIRTGNAAMFCPNCAADNQTQTRFCRSCGTDLEVVARALNNRPGSSAEFDPGEENKVELTQLKLQLQTDGIQRIIRGALIFLMGILFGIPLALFGKDSDWHTNWILVWLVLCGWLPVWGAIIFGTGLSNLFNSSITQRRIDRLLATRDAISLEESGRTLRMNAGPLTDQPTEGGNERTTASMKLPSASQ